MNAGLGAQVQPAGGHQLGCNGVAAAGEQPNVQISRADIDGRRAIAMTAVVLRHLWRT